MATPVSNDIEREFARLSPEDQLSLLERLVHQTKVSATSRQTALESELEKMASDPQMQAELERISSEFAGTESDGLERR